MNKLKVLSISIILMLLLSLVGQSFDVSARPQALGTDPGLGVAESFSVLAALSMSAAGAGTIVQQNLGLSPGLAVSRTGPWAVGGTEYFGPLTLAADAQTAALGAFNNLAGQTSDGPWGVAPWSPAPGVWTTTGSPAFSGTITLNGDYDDVWVFQISTDFTFSGAVVLAGEAQACHVYWQVGRDATIASGSSFAGTLIASRDITLVSGATVDGRVISLNGALTTDGNNIFSSPCIAPTAVPPTATASATTPPGVPTATTPPGGPTAPPISGLPNTGGAPIQNQAFPWGLLVIASVGVAALALGLQTYRRTHLPKQ